MLEHVRRSVSFIKEINSLLLFVSFRFASCEPHNLTAINCRRCRIFFSAPRALISIFTCSSLYCLISFHRLRWKMSEDFRFKPFPGKFRTNCSHHSRDFGSIFSSFWMTRRLSCNLSEWLWLSSCYIAEIPYDTVSHDNDSQIVLIKQMTHFMPRLLSHCWRLRCHQPSVGNGFYNLLNPFM